MEEKAFRRLIVWKRGHSLTLAIYKASKKFPRHELFGMTSLIRRSAASVGANNAEGYALGSSANNLRYLNIAVGSSAETEYHLELAHDLFFLANEDYTHLCNLANEVGTLLSRLKPSIKRNSHQDTQRP
jgi:four helix bundle protein